MLKEKATEFYVELDNLRREFESQLENRPFPVDTKVKRRNRKGRR